MADVSSASPKVYTIEDLQQHKSREDCWVLISGKVYDVTKFLDEVSSAQFAEPRRCPAYLITPTVPSMCRKPHRSRITRPSRSVRVEHLHGCGEVADHACGQIVTTAEHFMHRWPRTRLPGTLGARK